MASPLLISHLAPGSIVQASCAGSFFQVRFTDGITRVVPCRSCAGTHQGCANALTVSVHQRKQAARVQHCMHWQESQHDNVPVKTALHILQAGSEDVCMVTPDLLLLAAPCRLAGDPSARLEQPLGSAANDVCTLKCPDRALCLLTQNASMPPTALAPGAVTATCCTLSVDLCILHSRNLC